MPKKSARSAKKAAPKKVSPKKATAKKASPRKAAAKKATPEKATRAKTAKPKLEPTTTFELRSAAKASALRRLLKLK
jgi:hypothetical protein